MTQPVKNTKPVGSILFMADCHIRKRTWSNFAKVSDDAYFALTKIQQQIPTLPSTLLIGGDWFDTDRPSTTDILKSAEFFANFSRVLYIPGNHDRHCGEIFSALQETSKHLTESTEFIDVSKQRFVDPHKGAWVIAGLPYIHDQEQFIAAVTELVLDVKNEYPNSRLYLVLHANFKHLLGFEGAYHISNEQIKDIAGNYPVSVLVGHVHTRDLSFYGLRIPEQNDAAWVHSPGSLYPSDFRQAVNPEAIPSVTVLKMGIGDLIDYPVPVRAYRELTFTDYDSLETELKNIAKFTTEEQYPLPAMVRLHVPADMLNSSISVPAELADKIILQITTAGVNEQELEVNAAEGYSMIEATKEALAAYGEDAEQLSEYAEALLTSEDVLGTIDEWLEFWGVMRTYVTKGIKNVKTDQTLSK